MPRTDVVERGLLYLTLSVLLSFPGAARGIAACSQAGNTHADNFGSSLEITTQQPEDNLKQGIEIDTETRASFRDRTETQRVKTEGYYFRSKHIKVEKERYLLRQNTAGEFRGKPLFFQATKQH